MNRTLFPLLLLLLAGCAGEGTLDDDDTTAAVDDDDTVGDDDDSTPAPTFSEPLSLTTPDGLTLRGTYQAAPGVSFGPGVVLLHEHYGDAADFVNVWSNFLSQGIAVLAVDMRNHGNSPDGPVDIADLRTDPTQLPVDARVAIEALLAQEEVDPSRVGVLGLDVGANLAILAADASAQGSADPWGVRAFVAMSPDVAGIEALTGEELADLDLRRCQIVAGTNDVAAAADAQAIYDVALDPKDLRIVLGTGAHGATLLNASADAQTGVVTFLATQLAD